MMGKARRHFLERNEASTRTDQRSHYKICLWREEAPSEQHCWSSRSTDGGTGARSPEPAFLALGAGETCIGTSMGVLFSKVRVKDGEQYGEDRNT